MNRNLTKSDQSPLLLAILLSVPAILEQLLVTATSYVDTAMVGSLGSGATAAISITSSSIWLIGGIVSALAVGCSVRAAYYIGADDVENVRTVLIQSVLVCLILGIAAAVIGIPLSFRLPVWMGAAREIQADASAYMLIIMLFMISRVFNTVFSAIMRCMGDTRTPMFVNTGINLLNVVLNFLLIYQTREITVLGHALLIPGAGMGVAGAGLATGISLSVGGAWLAWKTLRCTDQYCPVFHGNLRLRKRYVLDILRIALPVALERIVISGGQIIMTRMVSTLGTVALAANYAAVTAEQICYMPAYGIASASTALVSQNLGAGKTKEAKHYGVLTGWIGVGLTLLLATAMFLCSNMLGHLMSSDPETAALTGKMLRIVSVAEPMFSMSTIMSGALRGAGEAQFPFYVGVICMLCVRTSLGALLLFHFGMGLEAVWYAMVVDLNLRGILNYARFCMGKWMKKELRLT